MSEFENYEPKENSSASPQKQAQEVTRVQEAPAADVIQFRSAKQLCGRAIGPVVTAPANANELELEGTLFGQLPEVIRQAVEAWAHALKCKPWRFRREVMNRFASVFADQFDNATGGLDEDAYEGMKHIGFTCLLERLDDNGKIYDLHQARLYLESVHDDHRQAAEAFLSAHSPRALIY